MSRDQISAIIGDTIPDHCGEEFTNLAADRIIAARLASTWQPIETAPKDGSWIVLTGGELEDQWEGEEKRPVVARWRKLGELSYRDGWKVSGFDSGYGTLYYDEPTQWAPLS